MIVSVHIPKTAGSSFKALLEETYGSRLCQRYEQKPLRRRTEGRAVEPLHIVNPEQCEVLHGHFVADTLRGIDPEACRYAVWLRHPVERVISHYHYWQRHPDPDQPLCRAISEEGMTLEAFAQLEAMRNVQSFFLGKRPLERFDFVGITERFEESMALFNRTFGTRLETAASVNRNPDQSSYREQIGEALYGKIEAWNSADAAIYEQASSLMAERAGNA
jgi:hypothetical protein